MVFLCTGSSLYGRTVPRRAVLADLRQRFLAGSLLQDAGLGHLAKRELANVLDPKQRVTK